MIKVITGNEAAAYGAMLSRPKVICGYPITPQSRIPELLSEFCAQGLLDAKFVNVESEIASLGYLIGASSAGVRVFTATASQGLAIMHEQLHWASGSRLPIVMVDVNRTLASPGSLHAEMIDTLCERDNGWLQFYCESNQEILDSVIQAYKISESVELPSMVILEGVYLSYINESTDIPEQAMVDEYLPPYEPKFEWPSPAGRIKLIHPRPLEAGGYPPRYRMGQRYEMQKAEDKCLDVVSQANEEFKSLFGREYLPVEEYKCDDADLVLVMVGSSVGTGRYVIDRLRENGTKVGLVKIRMFRPFPKKPVRKALAGRKKIAVIERDISPGQCGIFFQEIKWALNMPKVEGIPMYGFISGLGGEDITPRLIEKAILFSLENDPPEQEAIFLGLPKKEKIDEDDGNYIKIS